MVVFVCNYIGMYMKQGTYIHVYMYTLYTPVVCIHSYMYTGTYIGMYMKQGDGSLYLCLTTYICRYMK
jgi:hypothetical protein